MPDHSDSICPECGCVLLPDAPRGLCAGCLIAGMLDSGMPSAGNGALPREFGAYVLLEEVARGGMGIIYKARQPQLNRTIALKVMVGGQFAAPDFVERFQTEAGAAASLDHPNIVPVYEAGECEGQPFFSMKLIEGRSLAERLANLDEPIPEREAAEIIAKLAHAVHYAHQRGILHRDIKPGNVLLDEQGEPHLTDFGLAKLVEKDSALTRTMAMLGTPSYMSPEQARGEAKQLTTAVDVYGLGAVFYELLTCQPPFAGGTTMETVRQVLQKEPRRPSGLRPGINRDLETICLKCLEKDPTHRYASSEALAADIDRWSRHEPIRARRSPPLERVAKWVRRNQGLFGALAAIALLLVAGTSVSVWQAVRANQNLDESRQNEHRAKEARREATDISEHRRRELVKLRVAAGNKLVQDGDAFAGMLYFADALRLEGEDPVREDVHRRRLAAVLHTVPELKQLWLGAGLVSARFDSEGKRVVCGDEQGRVQVCDTVTGKPLFPPIVPENGAIFAWFTAGGEYLAIVASSGKLRHWDAATGQPAGLELPTMIDSTVGRTWDDTFDYGPDGRLLIAIVDEGVRFFSVPGGEPAGPLLAPSTVNGKVSRVRFSPDGKTASICGQDPPLQIVEVTSGNDVRTPPVGSGPLRRSLFFPDGRTLATMTEEGRHATLDIWDLQRGERRVPTQRVEFSFDIQVSSDGRHLALGGEASAYTLDAVSGLRPVTAERMWHNTYVSQFEFSRDGGRLATASLDRTARIWDSETGRPLTPGLRHTGFVYEARFSPDGKSLLTVCGSLVTRLWGLRSGTGERVTLPFACNSGTRVCHAPDGRMVAIYDDSGSVEMRETDTGRNLWTSQKDGPITASCFNRDGTRLLVSVGGGIVECSESATGRVVVVADHSAVVNRLEFSPDAQCFLTAGEDGAVRLWDARDGTALGVAMRHHGPVLHASFSADGRQILTGGEDKTVRVWDAQSGEPSGAPLTLDSEAVDAMINADGTRILTVRRSIDSRSGSVFKGMRLWDAKTRQPVQGTGEWPIMHGINPNPVVFSSDGRRFLRQHDTNSVVVCDATTGERTTPLMEDKYELYSASFSPDGSLVLTGAGRGVRVWEAETGEPVSPVLWHDFQVRSAKWSANGREVIAAGTVPPLDQKPKQGGISIWDISPVDLPLEKLTQKIELLAAHRLDPRAGVMALTREELRSRWETMSDRTGRR